MSECLIYWVSYILNGFLKVIDEWNEECYSFNFVSYNDIMFTIELSSYFWLDHMSILTSVSECQHSNLAGVFWTMHIFHLPCDLICLEHNLETSAEMISSRHRLWNIYILLMCIWYILCAVDIEFFLFQSRFETWLFERIFLNSVAGLSFPGVTAYAVACLYCIVPWYFIIQIISIEI